MKVINRLNLDPFQRFDHKQTEVKAPVQADEKIKDLLKSSDFVQKFEENYKKYAPYKELIAKSLRDASNPGKYRDPFIR